MIDSSTDITGAMLEGDGKPWYRHTWPWVLILIPFAAVLFGILMIYMVTRYPDDLMVDNYYKEGMAINRSLSMDARAQDLGVEAALIVSNAGQIRFSMTAATDTVIVLELFHVTDREQDKVLILYPEFGMTEENAVIYSATNQDMDKLLHSPGIWYLQLSGSDDQWRLRQRIQTPVQQLAIHSQ